MSEKNVNMVAMMGGKMVSVGSCNPGQARILQKQGMAEWKDGKLWLRNTMDSPPVAATTLPSPDEVAKALAEWRAQNLAEHRKEMAEIDPEGLCCREYHSPAEVLYKDMSKFLANLFCRREQGHDLVWYDDPRNRMLGFLDYQTNEWVRIGLTALRATWDSDFHVEGVDINMLRSTFSTVEGRESLTGDSPSGRYYSLSGEQIAEEECLATAGVESLADLWFAPGIHPCNVCLADGNLTNAGWRSDHNYFHLGSPNEKLLRAAKWTVFIWPEDKETLPVYRPDEEGNLHPFPPEGENDHVWGLYARIGWYLLRAWFPDGDRKPTWDIAFLRLLEDKGLIYVLMESKPIDNIHHLLEMDAALRLRKDKQS